MECVGTVKAKSAMLALSLPDKAVPLNILCIGAHSDDIEIGCAATLLRLLADGYRLRVTWAVLSAVGERADEARSSAEALLSTRADAVQLDLGAFRDSYFPADFEALKGHFVRLRERANPDVVFTHAMSDGHQDHRLVAELTWQTWRNHLVLEYEVPKYEDDLARPNVFVPVSRAVAQAKVDHLLSHFGSQRSKRWFSSETFAGLLRLRGVQCGAEEGFAEAFVSRKLVL